MKLTLSRSEMLSRWMLMRGYGPARADAVITRVDAIDVEARMEAEMRRWYLDVLAKAPPALLGVTDVAADVALRIVGEGRAEVVLPASVCRVVELTLEGWHSPALIVPEGSAAALRQDNPMTRGGLWRPVAVMSADGLTLSIRSLPEGPKRIVTLKVVADTGPSSYVFDESLFPNPDSYSFSYDK